MNKLASLDHQTFNRLSKIYIIALGAIALFTIGAQFFIQQYLSSQIDDSKIINISGRQRMLSQKLSKEILLLSYVKNDESKKRYLSELETTIHLWKTSHERLRRYNDSIPKGKNDSTEIKRMFLVLQPYFETIYENSSQILALVKNDSVNHEALQPYLDNVIFNEPLFLKQMDAIVFRYEKDAQEKISRLKKIEYSLFGLIILILIFEFFLLFRPVALSIKKTISNLLISQKDATDMASNAEKLRKIQNENVQELVSLTKALDQTLLYARVNEQGIVKNLGERFGKVLNTGSESDQKNLAELMNLSELQANRLLLLIAQNKGGVFNEEFEFTSHLGKKMWLDISILNVFRESDTAERLVLCSDISKRKEAQLEIERLNDLKYQQKEELQKSNASQIVEAQEEERKRIAKEIHDSIGQMLTALKFNIESINTDNIEKTNQKIEGLKKLSKDLILGIRTATFNLTPPELKDYGISIALQKMAKELSKLTGKNIVFENTSNPELRFNSLVETNLYRVTQEAVNNAIKYAKSDYILISINSSESILSIIIDDNGQGFDLSKIPTKPKNNAEGGMGLFFMKERMNYIDGRIFISSTLGKGTRISLNYNFS
ncbi:type IV pili methyl-accepting chemotaxis transducer N-terminal domain-containing protein [uncultured Aquimarina sp.]|uniref:ATP-binding protein n=1 Tax=uncultured Aquimarina sp. TaxID=575652 RepID=UPI00261DDC31|nr:type IV pili methyl-accepting chemotaxis transducer N-terminal domain-containing protein [uncultured Aquimarina sp.]